MNRPLKTLLFSTLYPSSVRPAHGIFVETRLRELLKTRALETKVVAPVPWFPSASPRWGSYGLLAATPLFERHNGQDVFHPRYFLPPKIGMNLAPFTLAMGALRTIQRLQREGFDFDLIDAHYYYPDGVAAALLARYLKKPFVVTARGTDINLIPDFSIPRRLIQSTARAAFASISVCQALSDQIAHLCPQHSKRVVLRNGVDLQRFRPIPRDEARAALGWKAGFTLLCVGYLVERKGHHLVIGALPQLPDCRLVIVGDGHERAALAALAKQLGVDDRVTFAGALPQEQLCSYYSAADLFVLASSREGWANVLLESMACGTPVVATRIWGTPEVVAVPEAGELAEERSSAALVRAVRSLRERMPEREAVRRYAERFSWDETSAGQLALFREVLAASRSP